MKILTELQVKTPRARQRAYTQRDEEPQAYLKVLEGDGYRNQTNKEANAVAKRLYHEAVDLDPNYPMANIGLARLIGFDVLFVLVIPRRDALHSRNGTKGQSNFDELLAEA